MARARIALLVAGVLLFAGAQAAGAAPPIFQEQFREVEPLHLSDELTDLCGFELWHETVANVKVQILEDGTEVTHVAFKERIVNLANGRQVWTQTGATFRDVFSEEFDPEAETLTIDLQETATGLPVLFRQPGQGVFVRDAGLVTFQVHVVLDVSDPENPEEIDFDFQTLELHGPHPFLLDTEAGEALLCDALS